MQYQPSSASLFSIAARRTGTTYTYHYDYPSQQWNVFEVMDGHEIFIQSFESLEEAQAFCNGEVIHAG